MCGEEVRCVPTTCVCGNLTSLWSCFALINSASHTHTHTWEGTDVMWQLLRPLALMWRYYPFCDPIKHTQTSSKPHACAVTEQLLVISHQRRQWISLPIFLLESFLCHYQQNYVFKQVSSSILHLSNKQTALSQNYVYVL